MDNDRAKILFRYGHLPPHLQFISEPFYELAMTITNLHMTPERTLALQHLWDAKNLIVFTAAEAAEPNRKGGE